MDIGLVTFGQYATEPIRSRATPLRAACGNNGITMLYAPEQYILNHPFSWARLRASS